MIIRPNPGHIITAKRFVDVGMPKSRVTMKGRYMLRVIDAATGDTVRETPWFDNIILDSGLNRWGTGNIIGGAAIGTGTATPTAADTGLQTESTFTGTSGTGSGISAGISPDYNNTRTFVYRTALGALNGNYTEVGVGWQSGSMFSRALILDGGGNPTTISVTSAQQLDIYYQLSVYPPLTDFSDTIAISGTNYDVDGRAANVTSTTAWPVDPNNAVAVTFFGAATVYNGSMGAITSAPSGSGDGLFASTSTTAYSNLSLQQEGSLSYGLNDGNVSGGISAALIQWGSLGRFQYEFDPAIPKDGTKTLVLNFRVSWARR
jgi:hypothetical protein